MVKIDENLTRKVAELARIELSGAEVALFTQQLADVLRYMDQLNTVGTDGIEPLTHPHEVASVLRRDEARPSPRDERGRPKVLSCAPETEEDGYKVPQIL